MKQNQIKQLFNACENNDINIVNALISNKDYLNVQDQQGSTPLHVAALNGHGEVVKILLDVGANYETPNKNGWTPLSSAAEKGHGEVVKILLEKGANYETQQKQGATPLNSAANTGHGEVVKILLEKGANYETPSKNGWTPLNSAAEKGHGEVIRVIVAHVLNKSEGVEEKTQAVKKFLREFVSYSIFSFKLGKAEFSKILKEEFVKSLITSNKLFEVDENQYFPKSLFVANESSLQKSSPYALFDVVLAVGGDQSAFRNLTLPSQLLRKKNIILDSSSFKEFDGSNQLAVNRQKQIVERLVKNGFNVYLCVKNKEQRQVSELQQTQDQYFISLKDKSAQEIEELLKNQTLDKYVLSEDSLSKLTKFDSSLASDSILAPDIKQLLTIFGFAFVSSPYQHDSDIDHDLFADINQQEINLIREVLEKDGTLLDSVADLVHTSPYKFYIVFFISLSSAALLWYNLIEHYTGKDQKSTPPQDHNQDSSEEYLISALKTISHLLPTLPGFTKDFFNYVVASIFSGDLDVQSLQTKSDPNQIYIAKDGDVQAINDQDGSKQSFQMKSVGEILSSNIKNLKTRTGIYQSAINANGFLLTKLKSNQVALTGVAITSITNSQIAELKKATDGAYVKFTSKLQANKKQRLNSIDTQERLVGVLDDINGLTIERGDDGFFYATSSQDREFSYVLDGGENMLLFGLEEMLPDNNPIKKIIDDYRDPAKGFVTSVASNFVMPKIQNGDISAWKEQVYQQRAGACRHRVAIVYDKIISQYPEQKQNLRITSIDGNHLILEARADNKSKWLQIDLGGAESDLVYEKSVSDSDSKKSLMSSWYDTLFDKDGYKFFDDDQYHLKTLIGTTALLRNSSYSYPTLVFVAFTATITYLYLQQRSKIGTKINLVDLEEIIIERNSPKTSPRTTITISKHEYLSQLAKENTQELLQVKKQPHKINSLDELFDQLTTDNLSSKKTLLVTKDHKEIAQLVIERLRANRADDQENKLKIFYLNNPNQAFKSSHLNINQEGEVEIVDGSIFKRFLQTQADGEGCVIVVDWSAFSNRQILALNTIIDQYPSFDGIAIAQPTIISITQEIPNDPSFLSRHNSCLEINQPITPQVDLQVNLQRDADEVLVVDLQGFIDWKQKLFGVISLNEGEIKWQQSEFYEKVVKGHRSFKIINLSKSAKKEFEQELKIAKSVGYYDYFGYKLPADFKVSFVENELNFSQFFEKNILEKSADLSLQDHALNREFQPLTINYQSDATLKDLPRDYKIVNGHSFDFLLKTKKIANGNYYQEQGLIAQHQNQSLNLFLTTKLSDQQYYALCKEAFENNVFLNLYLAPAIELPSVIKASKIKISSQSQVSATSSSPQTKPQIFVSNDPKSALQEIQRLHSDIYAVIDVEDYGYSQLFVETKFQRQQNSFRDFQEIRSEFYQRLSERKKIILKGQFSDDLLEILHPVLAGQDPNIRDNLILLIEDKKISKRQDKPSYLSLLGESYQVKHYDSVELNATAFQTLEVENKDSATDFEVSSKEKSAEFLKRRKDNLSSILKQDCLVQLVGHSGVGKTQLVKRLEEDSSYVIYNEIANFEAWALDQSNKIKVLFIDEANIEDSHLTKFSPLKDTDLKSGKKATVRLLHNGKFYELSKNHKVIFARNPENYSANRNPQKLFDQDVKSLYLRDFPSSYIYEEILKTPIYEQLSPDIKALIPEQLFKQQCKKVIESYQDFNHQKRQEEDDVNCKTVRELQEEILVFIHDQVEARDKDKVKVKSSILARSFEIEEENPEENPNDDQIISKNFISTTATKQAEKTIRTAIQIRAMQRAGNIGSATGLNGLIIEGSPGIGKTEMIRAALEAENILQGSVDSDITIDQTSDQTSSTHQKFYKIEAGTSPDKMKQIIIKAYEQGNIVWIDEINSCIDNSDLEKTLNAVLTGKHPEGKKEISQKPGFMLISSINPPILAGRSQLSPALKHRSTLINTTPLTQYHEEDLAKICEHMLKNSTITLQQQDCQVIAKSIAQTFKQELSNNPLKSLSLRDLSDIVKTISTSSFIIEDQDRLSSLIHRGKRQVELGDF